MKDKLNSNLQFSQKRLWPLLLLFACLNNSAQIANYINNGSFEQAYNCNWPNGLSKAKSWSGIDSANYAASYMSACPNFDLVPSDGTIYQYPRSGIAYALATFYCTSTVCISNGNRRVYLKNRLKEKLISNQTYCVKFYVNVSNSSTHGIDGFGIFFGDETIDTITKYTIPLDFIIPQVQNQAHNIITDTVNWVPITGTFVASGNEKYALIGNFRSDNNVDTMLFNSTNSPLIFTDVGIDDVSCVPLNLSAFAGNDTTCIAGTSVYIGRPRDVGIDEDCMWYKLPIVITPTTPALDTAAGIWVSPTQTSTYVVRQEICGIVKWDTVVVRQDWTGIRPYTLLDGIRIYPNPANDRLFFNYLEALENERMSLRITDLLGVSIREEEIQFRQRQLSIDVQSLPAGTYFAILKDRSGVQKYEKLIIER